MSGKSAHLVILLILLRGVGRTSAGTAVDQRVTFTYVKSPYADFLFYLFYRSTGQFPGLKSDVPLDDIAPLQDDFFLPNDAAASGITTYAELYKLASTYDARVLLTQELQKGEPHYAPFFSFWQKRIAPTEEEAISTWRKQDAEWPPIAHLEQLERLKFPFSSIKIAAVALNPQANSMQGPPTIFTSIQVPSLAWTIGHEGTHMMLGPRGADWKKRKHGDEAIRLVIANGGSDYGVEEALCLLMQAKLSIAYGETPKDYLSSRDFTEPSSRRTLLLALERDWPSYLTSPDTNIADFLIAETIKTFGHR